MLKIVSESTNKRFRTGVETSCEKCFKITPNNPSLIYNTWQMTFPGTIQYLTIIGWGLAKYCDLSVASRSKAEANNNKKNHNILNDNQDQ